MAEEMKLTEDEKLAQELVEEGKRGRTKHQMIAAIKKNVDNPENLKVMARVYGETFAGSLRYVGKAVRNKVLEVVDVPNYDDDDTFKALNERLRPKRKGVTFHQIIIALEDAVERNDFEEVRLIKKYYPEKVKGSQRYISKKYLSAIEEA